MSEYMGNDPIQNIRIQSKLNEKIGHQVTVSNADTDGNIGNVKQIVVLLEPREINKAVVTYYKVNAQGHIEAGGGQKPIEITEELDYPEIDLTALPVPAKLLTKVSELWEIAEKLAQLGSDPRQCPLCHPEPHWIETERLLHTSSCLVGRAIKVTREG